MNKDIAIIPKNGSDEIRVAITEYKGFDLLDMRVFSGFKEGEEKKPTKKGLSIGIKLLPELIEALQKARNEARAGGLLE